MKKLISIVFLALSANLWAQGITLPEGISADGVVTLNCNDNAWTAEAPVRLEVSIWGEGKLRVGLFFSETISSWKKNYFKQTQPSSLHFVALDNGFGSYELFESNSVKAPVGELVLFQRSSSVKFNKNLNGLVKARYTWDSNSWNQSCSLNALTTIKFYVVTPKCFNKRGKEISCPEIKF